MKRTLAAAAVLLAAAGCGSAVQPRAQVDTTVSAAAQALPVHAGTAADPVPWVDQQVGPADVPGPLPPSDFADLGGGAPMSCPGALSGSLVFTPAGAGYTGLLRLTSAASCTLCPDATLTLGTHKSSSDRDKVAPGLAAPDFGRVSIGPGLPPAEATVTLAPGCATPAATAHVDNDDQSSGTVTVSGLDTPGTACSADGFTLGPLGSSQPPPVPPASRAGLVLSLSTPATGTADEPMHASLVLRNPTAAAIPLSPCPGVAVTMESGSASTGGSDSSQSFELNCAQAPSVVPPGGALTFAVEPTADLPAGPVRVTAGISYVARSPVATVSLHPKPIAAQAESPCSFSVGPETPDGNNLRSVVVTVAAACQLPAATVTSGVADKAVGPISLSAGQSAVFSVRSSADRGCSGPNTAPARLDITLGDQRLFSGEVATAGCRTSLLTSGPIATCPEADLRVDSVTHDSAGYHVELHDRQPGECVLAPADLGETATGPAVPVLVGAVAAATVTVSCSGTTEPHPSLGLAIDGVSLDTPPAAGETEFASCSTGGSLAIA